MYQSFISYKKYRYGICAALVSLAAIIAYLLDSPGQPPNGGTPLGYTLGTIATLLIGLLMWFGIRKRAYQSSFGTLNGWLSAHVYFGVTLLLVTTLHSGFQFGPNVHTVAYALMCLVIVSGGWGAYTYLRYPQLIIRQRGNLSREQLFENIKDLDRQALMIGIKLDTDLHDQVSDAIRRTTIGGSLWAQLSSHDGSKVLLFSRQTGRANARIVDNRDQHTLIEILAGRQARSKVGEEIILIQDLLENTASKAVQLRKLRKDIQLQGLLQFWLYFHVPLSFGLLAAVLAHVVAVFLYW